MTPILVALRETQTLAAAAAHLASQDRHGAPVLDEQGILQGVLTQTDIERVVASERSERYVEVAMKREVLVIRADEMLDQALEELTAHGVSWAPVVEATAQDQHVVGVVSAASIMQLYRDTANRIAPLKSTI